MADSHERRRRESHEAHSAESYLFMMRARRQT